jgi:hypothetical protein
MAATGSARLDPAKVVASFDSASVLHAANRAALRGESFPHLGNPDPIAVAVRAAGHLPWPVLRGIYARIGGAEGIRADRLDRVDMTSVAASFADAFPRRRYPAVLVGATNGALVHLAAALQIPWLPGTVLIPVARVGDPARPDLDLRFGQEVGSRLLDANPDIVLHQMHDEAQDALMAARMTYFRTKWSSLPDAYARFLDEQLAPGAPVLVAEDTSRWPVTRVGERHVFQNGGRGGLEPADYLRGRWSPTVDDDSPEAEWGGEPGLRRGLRAWCESRGHPLVRLSYEGPQAPAGPVAETIRSWYAGLGRPTDRLIVPSFVLGDPWRTLQIGAVPYWTFFAVRPAVAALDAYLNSAEPYRDVRLLLFQHGTDSPGRARIDDWRRTVAAHGAELTLIAVDERKDPHDIGSLGRYGPALARLPDEPTPWTPLDVATALTRLTAAGLSVVTEPARHLADPARPASR